MNLSLDTIRNGVSWPDVMAGLPKVPVASAISGLVVAALILMTPNQFFEAFIVRTGLPEMLTAAEPPLGARARIVFALVAALAVTTGAWIALSIVVRRKARANAEYRYHLLGDEEARPLRRADAHPDAPYRRPIMAADDLGAPLDLVEVVPDDFREEEPLELSMADIVENNEPVEDGADTVAVAPEPVFEPEPRPVAEEADDEPIFTIPLPARDSEPEIAEAYQPQPAPVPERETVQVQAETTPRPRDARAELAELVARLEAGLERRRTRKVAVVPASGAAPRHPVSEPDNDRDAALREALDALQKLTAKGA